MTIRPIAFERAPRVASSALLLTKIACRFWAQCFLTSPIENTCRGPQNWGFWAKWGKDFLIGERNPQKGAYTCGDASFELLRAKIGSQILGVGELKKLVNKKIL